MIPFLGATIFCAACLVVLRLWYLARVAWVPVLCYHHVTEPPAGDTSGLYVTPQQFNDQLAHLRRNGFSPVTLDQVFDHVTGGVVLPHKPVAVTFDDGYLDNWIYAFPLLRHFEIPATLFIITSKIGEGDPRPTLDDVNEGTVSREALDRLWREAEARGEAWLNWRELSRMRAVGTVSLASHSHTHVDFREVDRRMALEELRTSRAMLQEQSGGECLDLAWPYGYHSRGAEKAARLAGFRSAYRISTRLFGARGNRPGANPLALRRLAVTPALDFERALEFYCRPALRTRLRALGDFIAYHVRKRTGRG